MRILNREAVAESLSHAECIDAVEAAMRAVSRGDTIMPLRRYMDIPRQGGKFTLMPGYLGEPCTFGVKIVSKYPRSPDSPYGSHVGAVMIFDSEQGIPLALLDGSELTAIRTAAASALATRILARADAATLAILGTGTQAQHHVQALTCVRPITELRVWGRTHAHARRLVRRLALPASVAARVCDSARRAVDGADIVCTTTSAAEPVLAGKWLAPGCHVNLVGAAIASSAEADVDVVTRSRFYVDYKASAMDQAGELLAAIRDGAVSEAHIAGEIGDVLAGRVAGRSNDREITVYKSLGVAAQDLAAAYAAFRNAESRNIGVDLTWD
ncbi:MAG: ornithine cyclodeaminase family protein [Gammaproteobacteria bacterium]|nr:ornithine cyclodeaminase family protein [Gammaproteobacteria bacterium]MDE0414809.1 ornithine cyclodeaminase family protein [Gammaproteobacteria bacterium]MDE0454487.1 ornithine cyclodeaminase family protein [Gammaproteobacteria bacterium]